MSDATPDQAPVKKKWGFWKIFGLFWIFLIIIGLFQRGEGRQGGNTGTGSSQNLTSSPVDEKLSSENSIQALASIFSIGSKYTDLQREEAEKEIKGKIVQWTLPVYEVRRISDRHYKVQTSSRTETIGTFIHIRNPSPEDTSKLIKFKTGDKITVKGKIDGVSLRNVELDPAILVPTK